MDVLRECIKSPAPSRALCVERLLAGPSIARSRNPCSASIGGIYRCQCGQDGRSDALHIVLNIPQERWMRNVGHQTHVLEMPKGHQDHIPSLRQPSGWSGFSPRHKDVGVGKPQAVPMTAGRACQRRKARDSLIATRVPMHWDKTLDLDKQRQTKPTRGRLITLQEGPCVGGANAVVTQHHGLSAQWICQHRAQVGLPCDKAHPLEEGA